MPSVLVTAVGKQPKDATGGLFVMSCCVMTAACRSPSRRVVREERGEIKTENKPPNGVKKGNYFNWGQ